MANKYDLMQLRSRLQRMEGQLKDLETRFSTVETRISAIERVINTPNQSYIKKEGPPQAVP